MTVGYRRDIDGLRAIAVVAVVLFHIGAVPGGFVGVDVFFVISGYLITGLIVAEQAVGRFTIAEFYRRRVRRIAPALLACLAGTTLVAAAILMPKDLETYGHSVLATLGFVSNVFFWRGTGYFDTGADEKPLLHTWSLAVEEQFYVLFPVLVLMLARWRRLQLAAVVSLFTLSFALSVVGIAMNKQGPTFYLFPTRAWELLLGALMAMGLAPSVSDSRVRTALGALGLALIGISVFVYSASTPFPGPAALLPCLGAALIIVAGREGEHGLSPLLASAPMVGVGLISYSLYLWHWPLLALGRYFAIRDLTVVEKALAVGLSCGLAYASWRFVEQPFRGRTMPFRRVALWMTSATVLVAAGAVALVLWRGLPARFSPQVASLNAAAGTMYRCDLTSYLAYGNYYACPLNLSSGDPGDATVVLWGDSHAQMYAPAVEASLTALGRHGILVPNNGCPPLADAGVTDLCRSVNADNLRRIMAPRVETVIIAMNFEGYAGRDYVTLKGKVADRDFRVLSAEIARTVRALSGKRVILVAPIPTPKYNLPSQGARNLAYGRESMPFQEPEATFRQRIRWLSMELARLDSLPNVDVIDPSATLCDGTMCRYVIADVSAFADNSHLTTAFVRELTPRFKAGLTERR